MRTTWLPARGVLEVGVGLDPGGDLGLDGLGQEPPGPVPKQVGQHVLTLWQGHDADVGGRLLRFVYISSFRAF